MSAGSHDRIIARLAGDTRRTLLDAIVRETTGAGSIVVVEHSADRKLAETAGPGPYDRAHTRTLCTVVGMAYVPGAGAGDVLVVRPVDPRKRLIGVPAAHVLRVSYAQLCDALAAGDYCDAHDHRGSVLAGPPKP